MLNKLLPIKFSPELYLDLKHVAAQEQISMASLIRIAVQKELAKRTRRIKLSELTQLAMHFPNETHRKTDDQVIYDL